MENLIKLLQRLPILPIAFLYGAYLYYDFYDWQTNPSSDLGAKKAQVVTSKADIEALNKKLATGEEFLKTLDAARERIRALTLQLESTKASLSADLDIASFVRLITLEVKKLGFKIVGIKPDAEVREEYYTSVPFTVNLQGAYVQMLVFFDRVSKFQQVIRISDFMMKPVTGSNSNKYVPLDVSVKLVAYKYQGSAADDIVNKDIMKAKEREAWGK